MEARDVTSTEMMHRSAPVRRKKRLDGDEPLGAPRADATGGPNLPHTTTRYGQEELVPAKPVAGPEFLGVEDQSTDPCY